MSRSPSLLPDNMIARWLLTIVLLAAIYFFHGFLVPVLAALIIGFASWPLYERLVALCRGRTMLAASLAVGIIILVLVIPFVFLITYGISEIRVWMEWLKAANMTGISVPPAFDSLPFVGVSLADAWQRYLGEPGALGELVKILSGEHIGNISRWVLATGTVAANLVLSLVFVMITLFFIYKDGTTMAAQLDRVGERILPLRWQRFSRVVPATVSSTVMGMTIIALGEGIVLGLAYKIAGVPSAFLLGVITGCMAMIPGGAPLCMTLVSLFLVFGGNYGAGIGLFLWGAVELFVVDKTIRPQLVGGPIRLPFLPTFFGLIGGVKTMGLVGIFIGPVLMALLVAIWREWLRTIEEERISRGGETRDARLASRASEKVLPRY